MNGAIEQNIMKTNPFDLSRAIHAAAANVDALVAAHSACGPVESIILLPLIKQARESLNTLIGIRDALQCI